MEGRLFALVLLAAGLAFVAETTPSVAAQPRMTLQQAVDLCTERARKFALVPYGRHAEEPPRARVEQDYRACVYANSRRYPVRPPEYRDSIMDLFRKRSS